MGFDLRDRNVVVTGARGGLGGAVVDALLAAGAICHLPVRGADGGPARDRVKATPGVDLTSETAVAAYYAGLPKLWASIHLAGGYAGAPLVDTTLADFRAQIDINLVTAFLCSREAVRCMSAGGRIVNVASHAALVPAPGKLAYAAAKAGVVALTEGLAAEVRASGILVNALAPTTIDTPTNRGAMPKADPSQWTSPANIATSVLWLVSPENTLVTGAVIDF